MENSRPKIILSAAISIDLMLTPPATHSSRGYPRWSGSDAQLALRNDVNAGIHLNSRPQAMHSTRDVYSDFPLDVFRGHIYQEVRCRKETSYWKWRQEQLLKKQQEKRDRRQRREQSQQPQQQQGTQQQQQQQRTQQQQQQQQQQPRTQRRRRGQNRNNR